MEGPSGDDRPRGLPGRPSKAVLAPILIAVLLGVVVIVAAGRRAGSGAGGHGPGLTFYEYLFSSISVAWAVGGIVLFYVFLRQRQLSRKQRAAWDFRGARLLVYLLVFLTFLFIIREPLRRLRQSFAANRVTPPGPPRGGGAGRIADPQQLEFRWAPVFVALVLGLALLAAAAVGIMRRRNLKKPARTMAEALADVMDDALDDIRAERDPRKAIIAVYARLERLLAGFGRPREPSEAPFEYLARVLLELNVSRHPVEELTELFERAKFSAHALGADDKARAIEALEAVRDELRAPVEVASEEAPVPA